MRQQYVAAILLGTAVAVVDCMAQDGGGVTVYGRFNMTGDYVNVRDATEVPPTDRPTPMTAKQYKPSGESSSSRITSNSSLFGMRGKESVGRGWNVVWQVESSVSPDVGSGTISGRNSFVGFDGPYGYLIVGNHDSPYKLATVPLAPFFAPTSADYFNILGSPGFGVPVTGSGGSPNNNRSDASFDRRVGNSFFYRTGRWNGMQAYFQVSTGDDVPERNAWVWSAQLSYQNGGLVARYAYERHDDYFGLVALGGTSFGASNRSSRDDAHKVVLEYKLGSTTLSGVLERLTYRSDDTVAANIKRYARNAWWLQARHAIGAGFAYAGYGKAGDGSCDVVGEGSCQTNGLGAQQLSFGYAYLLSKRTALFGFFTQVDNDESGQYSIIQPLSLSPGVTTRIVSIGINHRY